MRIHGVVFKGQVWFTMHTAGVVAPVVCRVCHGLMAPLEEGSSVKHGMP